VHWLALVLWYPMVAQPFASMPFEKTPVLKNWGKLGGFSLEMLPSPMG
jgi:hypothetical protein